MSATIMKHFYRTEKPQLKNVHTFRTFGIENVRTPDSFRVQWFRLNPPRSTEENVCINRVPFNNARNAQGTHVQIHTCIIIMCYARARVYTRWFEKVRCLFIAWKIHHGFWFIFVEPVYTTANDTKPIWRSNITF